MTDRRGARGLARLGTCFDRSGRRTRRTPRLPIATTLRSGLPRSARRPGSVAFPDVAEGRWHHDSRDVDLVVRKENGDPPGFGYSVTVNREDDDWYEVWGRDIYIETLACPRLALGGDAVLVITGGGLGTMYVEDEECMVEGVYAKMRL